MTKKLIELKGVGEKVALQFREAGIESVDDLLNYFPRDYRDYSHTDKISALKPGLVTARVRFEKVKGSYRRGGMHITTASAYDDTGKIKITWFNQPYRSSSIKETEEYFVSGELEFKYGSYQLVNPSLELTSDMPKNTARILPIYPERRGVKSTQLRKIFSNNTYLFDDIDDLLPASVLGDASLISRRDALEQIHIPTSKESLDEAKKRIGFEEVFELQLAALISKQESNKWQAPKLEFDADKTKQLLSKLSFKLTNGQRKAAWAILKDIATDSPMNRLMQGDVGSGKTIVAAMAIDQCLRSGWQAALMAPTEVLAKQHYHTIKGLLGSDRVVYLSSETKAKEKTEIAEQAESGEVLLYIGTHSLIQKGVDFSKLGLAVIDEQHRFGVEQRRHLLNKQTIPHLLSMTATPIPRSLALTVYGEMDVSVIDELPPGRKKVDTTVITFNQSAKVDEQIAARTAAREQVYIICPLIEESETISAKNAEEEYRRVTKAHKSASVGLLHGKLSSAEKDKQIADFKNGKLDILVSTTVVEVGVDVPNATLIVIEGAERFGLAQLHQLRGRVGRSDKQSSCLLVTSPGAQISNRLKAMEQTNNGFELAEIDMNIRGPGAIYGTRQHGALDLRIAKLSDTKNIAYVRQQAKAFLDREDINEYPALAKKVATLRSITRLN